MSWELRDSNSVLVGILHTDTTTVAWAFGVRNLIVPGREEHRRFSPFLPLAGMPYDHARNQAAKVALDLGVQWLFFLDSDVIPPKDAILRLIRHNVPIISGVYNRRSPPHAVPVMIRDGQWVTDFTPGEIVEVDLVGAGCLLIHRTVLEALARNPHRPGKPWFDWKVDLAGIEPQGDCLSEDFTLCQRVRKELGVKILVDTGVQCRHCGYAQATYGNFVPLETIPST